MSDIIIRAENLGKRYRMGQFVGYGTIRETLMNAFSAPFRGLRTGNKRATGGKQVDTSHETPDEFIWALKDVSFEVKQGEAVGIIGRNGAGKTTLLRILTRITEPTEGYAEIRGRVGSLLEVGTGFHQELTGRENIYLNGAVLGMKRKEIKRKFDEIVEFSGVAKFIDTPLKRYSTGMQVRLAFSVAAHLEPEILLVDEVLAVGDAAFQKKCLGKMGDVVGEGRTVLFVSHNMLAVQSLCSRALLLESGRLIEDGDADVVVRHYLKQGDTGTGERVWQDQSKAPGSDAVWLGAVRIVSFDGQITGEVFSDREFSIQIEYHVIKEGVTFNTGIYLFNEEGIQVFTSIDSTDPAWNGKPRQSGTYKSRCRIPANLLAPGRYNFTVQIKTMSPPIIHLREPGAISFDVKDKAAEREGIFRDFRGVIRPLLKWESEFKPNRR